MQHQPGMGFEYLAKLSTPVPGTTIKYCDSPYHIIFTNVKTKSQTYGQGVGPHLGWTPRRNYGYLACAPTEGRLPRGTPQQRLSSSSLFSAVRVPSGRKLPRAAVAPRLHSL